jgi:hypothetical protein
LLIGIEFGTVGTPRGSGEKKTDYQEFTGAEILPSCQSVNCKGCEPERQQSEHDHCGENRATGCSDAQPVHGFISQRRLHLVTDDAGGRAYK